MALLDKYNFKPCSLSFKSQENIHHICLCAEGEWAIIVAIRNDIKGSGYYETNNIPLGSQENAGDFSIWLAEIKCNNNNILSRSEITTATIDGLSAISKKYNDSTIGEHGITCLTLEQLVSTLEKVHAEKVEPTASVFVEIRKEVCPKCNNTGIIDMEIYTRACMDCSIGLSRIK